MYLYSCVFKLTHLQSVTLITKRNCSCFKYKIHKKQKNPKNPVFIFILPRQVRGPIKMKTLNR